MASRLFQGIGALAVQALRAYSSAWAAALSMMSRGGIPSNEEEAAGLERVIMMAARNDLDLSSMLVQKAAPGTKEESNLVPSIIIDKRIVGCIYKEDNNAVIWFSLYKGETQHCPNYGTHYKLVPYQFNH
ncbi:cytochrome c oxidase subunit 5B, mitochondrial-like [Dromiciops gliroides]|uniref:cytochrome c oxidase subunit 5B, mitochondrial-like n=1 Tax=Dromiciops gliroides TaxID=33562 RepID=UPI001CC60A7E|nr:cytochrome c oxidase subunit 5B, mitochondrial-like [Dromiciops gliroides]